MLIKRGKKWGIYKRIPQRFAAIDSRKFVWLSLHTDSESIAKSKAEVVWQGLVGGWEARLAGMEADAERRFAAAHNLAGHLGFGFMPVDQVAALPLPDLAKRVRATVVNGKTDDLAAMAVLGGAPAPKLTVMQTLDRYWTEAKDRTRGMSEDQIRRWKNPRIKAFKNFVAVVGDKPLDELTRDNMRAFRNWWADRLDAEGMAANSANKDIINLSTVLKFMVERLELPVTLPLGKLMFEKDERPRRPPFSEDWIKTHILASGALDELDREARCIVLAMVNTGCRPSEAAGLLPEHIRLDGPVPHISIEPVGRRLKTRESRRVIPLVGVSLDAFRECPKGFPTYRFKDRVSGVIGDHFDAHGLRETPDHSLYSLRHSFEDRMVNAGVDFAIRCELFGHKYDRPKYGNGASLERKAELLKPIAI